MSGPAALKHQEYCRLWKFSKWLFYFILDDDPNRIFNSMAWYDYVVVIVSPEALEPQMEALPNFDSLFQDKIKELMRE